MARRAFRAAALAAACTLGACAPGSSPAAGAAARAGASDSATAAASVDMPRSYLFRPETLAVRPLTRVTWTNHDVFTHGVKFAQEAGQLTARPGHAVSRVFAVPGAYPYVCPFHPQMMKGVIRVVAR